MDGYKFFQDGWVSDVMVWSIPAMKSACLVSGKVKHSQCLSAPPLQPWVAVEKEGCITVHTVLAWQAWERPVLI